MAYFLLGVWHYAEIDRTIMKKLLTLLPWLIGLGLFAIPFFWYTPGLMDLGGDSSRLYFYDPLAYLFSNTLYGVAASGLGGENINYFALPFITMLVGLRSLFSATIVIAISHGLALSLSFLFVYFVIRELVDTEKAHGIQSSLMPSVLGGLLYAFSPALMDGWQNVLLTHNQIFLNPLLFFLMLRYAKTHGVKYIFYALIVSLFFSPNFSIIAAPAIVAFYPISFLFFLVYSRFILKRSLGWGHIFFGVITFIGLHFFHLLPQLLNIFSPDSSVYQTIFSDVGKYDRGLGYFTAIAPNIKITLNLFLMPQMTNLGLFSWLFMIFPLVIVSSYIYAKKQTQLIFTLFFFFVLFFATANITSAGLNFYKSLFSIPGFSMFRNFYGQWQYSYIFYYSVLFGLSASTLFTALRPLRTIVVSVVCIALLVTNAAPFIRGSVVSRPLWQSNNISPLITIDPIYEEALAYVRDLPEEAKVLTLPITDPSYQLIAGNNGGVYVGPSTLSYLAGKKDFSGYEEFGNFRTLLFELVKTGEYEDLKKLLGMLNIKYIFFNADPAVYDSFPGFPYYHMRKAFPADQKAYRDFLYALALPEVKSINNRFFIYALPDKYFIPQIYAAGKNILLNQKKIDIHVPLSRELALDNIAFFVFTHNARVPQDNYDAIITSLEPVSAHLDLFKNTEDTRLPWAFVTQKMDSIMYPFIVWREKRQISKLAFAGDVLIERLLFLAEKRVNELLKFGKYTPILGGIVSIQAKSLDWQEPSLSDTFFHKPYDSWEVGMTRYFIAMKNLIDTVKGTNNSQHSVVTNLALIERQVKLHKFRMYEAIKQMDISIEDERYLTTHAVEIFEEIANKLRLDELKFEVLPYSLSEVAPGVYDIYIEKKELSSIDITEWQIRIGEVLLSLDQFTSEAEWFVYRGMTIDSEKSKILEIVMPVRGNEIVGNQWGFAKLLENEIETVDPGANSAKFTVNNGLIWSIPELRGAYYYVLSFDYKTGGKDFVVNWHEGEVESRASWKQNAIGELASADWKTFRKVVRTDMYSDAGYLQITKDHSNPLIDSLTPDVLTNDIEIKNFSLRPLPNPKVLLEKDESDTRAKAATVTFRRINPTKYRVHVTGITSSFTLVFNQLFNPKWDLVDPQSPSPTFHGAVARQFGSWGQTLATWLAKRGVRLSHGDDNLFLDSKTFETWGKKVVAKDAQFLVNGYGNAWKIEKSEIGEKQDITLIIELKTQNIFYASLAISFIVFVACLWMFLRSLTQ